MNLLRFYFLLFLYNYFSLGISLMTTICSKGNEYYQMLQEKNNTKFVESPSVESPLRVLQDPYNFEDQALRDSFMRQSDKLTILELEKEIMHARTILSLVFLPKLNEVDPAEVIF